MECVDYHAQYAMRGGWQVCQQWWIQRGSRVSMEPPFQQKLTTSSQNCSATKVLQQKLCKLASQLSRKILSMHALGMPSFVGFPLAKTSMVFIVVFYKIKEVEDLWHGVHKGFKGK